MLLALSILAALQVAPAAPSLSLEQSGPSAPVALFVTGAPPRSRVAFFARVAGTTELLGLRRADERGRARLQLPHSNRDPLARVAFSAQTLPVPAGATPQPWTSALVATLFPSFRDSFEGNALSAAWSIYNAASMQRSVSGGALHMQPGTGTPIWFNDTEGGLIYRVVSGDFTVTATVRVESPSQPGLPPPAQWRLGGVLVRNPNSAPGNRNSVHLAFGAGSNVVPIAVEDKNTISSASTFLLTPVTNTAGRLRIRRVGSVFSLYYSALPGGAGGAATPWQLVRTYDRPDLPNTLHLGVMSYAASSPANVVTHVDKVRIDLQ